MQESEVGFLTVVGCVGNMIASFGFGYLFDYISSKRMSLALAAVVSAGTYLLFLPSKTKAELYMSQFAVSAGTGLLYTVQCAMVRLLADERIGASFFGLVLSSMNIAALIGTALAGAISSDVDATPQTLPAATGYDGYEWCYIIGAIMGLLGLGLVPWITAQDPNLRDAPPAESLGTSLRKLQRLRLLAPTRKSSRRSCLPAGRAIRPRRRPSPRVVTPVAVWDATTGVPAHEDVAATNATVMTVKASRQQPRCACLKCTSLKPSPCQSWPTKWPSRRLRSSSTS